MSECENYSEGFLCLFFKLVIISEKFELPVVIIELVNVIPKAVLFGKPKFLKLSGEPITSVIKNNVTL